MSAVSMKGVSPNSDLKEMKSSWLANVITRLLSSFGTGKRYLRIFDTCVTKTFQLFEQTHRGGKKKKKNIYVIRIFKCAFITHPFAQSCCEVVKNKMGESFRHGANVWNIVPHHHIV